MSGQAVQCTGKRAFSSWAEARGSARWQAQRHAGARFGPYRCKFCGSYHVGERFARDEKRPRLEEDDDGADLAARSDG